MQAGRQPASSRGSRLPVVVDDRSPPQLHPVRASNDPDAVAAPHLGRPDVVDGEVVAGGIGWKIDEIKEHPIGLRFR